ncbi:MAG TPA: hypothetical protein VN634_12855 [Candidatus Limnocylindrales bacterium]|nr:hypothetical protein [Candidatus Limnocylindrales bacterium]
MSETRNQVTNGSDEQNERRRSGNASRESLANRGRQLQGDAQKLVGHVQEARSELQTFLTDTVRERPVATLAAAAGIGYVLGGGLSSRLTVLMLGFATRFGLAVAAREMGTWAAAGKMGEAPTPTRH